MAWYDPIKNLVNTIDTEYDRRIRSASNIKAYHPEGGGHGHHTALPAGEHTMPEEDAGGAGSEGALQGAAGPQYAADPTAEVIAQH